MHCKYRKFKLFNLFTFKFVIIIVCLFQVRIEAGKTLKDALKKAMSRREIEAESCEVYDVRTK